MVSRRRASDAVASVVPALQLTGLRKEYGGHAVVNDVDLSIAEGEFVTLLGPSGSGKTSILMMIAGFVRPDAGGIAISGRSTIDTKPSMRNIGLVFQNYALFPHMTVTENLAFPLKMRRRGRSEIRRRVDEMLDLVDLHDKAGHKPGELSGGQQQRVALARALVFDPAVVLLDEPLSALDRNLRERLQLEIKRIQRKMNATIILVTHDQQEALTMSDRIAVMNAGSILQCDRPDVVYESPAERFVAEFLGDSNFLGGRVRERSHGAVVVEDPDLGSFWMDDETELAVGQPVSAIVRPERMLLSSEIRSEVSNHFNCRVTEVVYIGDAVRYQVQCGRRAFIVKLPSAEASAMSLQPGSDAYLCWSKHDTTALRSEGSTAAEDLS